MNLSKRLRALETLIPSGSIVADVGTDHGLLIIECVLSGKSPHAYGLDIAEGPLQQAQNNVMDFNADSKISLQLSDGLKSFKGDASVYVIAGMGAETIWTILDDYKFAPTDTLIIQSNTKQAWLRGVLADHGFVFMDEVFLYDRDIPVFIMKLKATYKPYTLESSALYVGPCLQEKHDMSYLDYLLARYHHFHPLSAINTDLSDEVLCIEKFLKEKGVVI